MDDGPSPPQEPEGKKLRMSSTSTSSDNENCFESILDPPSEKKIRYKRRKIAIFFAYCGASYQGMQKNPGAKTIEGDLEEALYLSGAIPDQDRGCPRRFDFARSARTDKGVSAICQVVSGKFYIDPPGLIDRINSNLPNQIRIFGFKRVTASFSAKKFCDRRRYVYLVPVFALDPLSHRDREGVLASLGSENELVKCVECSERGRKVSVNNAESLSESGNREAAVIGDDTVSKLPEEDGKHCEGEGFSYGEGEKDRMNRILKHYVGTHNFHNFTARIKAGDPSAHRYIISFEANSTVVIDGMEFVRCVVVGQSFMLHQIRKMIGLAVAIMRNFAPESLIQTALEKVGSVIVPTAPEVGLYLDECIFTSYNEKWNETHEELSMKEYRVEAAEFEKDIYSHIAKTEHKDGVVALWLHSLNQRNYPDLHFPCNVEAPNEGNAAEGPIV